MAANSSSLKIMGCRTTEEGLLVKFSDLSFYLFHTSFLIENRKNHADHIDTASPWLAQHWTTSSVRRNNPEIKPGQAFTASPQEQSLSTPSPQSSSRSRPSAT